MELYKDLSIIYDHLMNHVDYKKWANFIVKILNKNFPDKKISTVLDCSCGTGTFLYVLHQKLPATFLGSDLSYPMLRRAKMKSLGFPLSNCNMTELPFNGSLDLIISLYDSINYLLSLSELESFFNSCYHALNPGGILIFDITTIRNSTEYFNQVEYTDRYIDIPYQRYSYFDQENYYQINQFFIYLSSVPVIEEHKQKIYSCEEIAQTIQKSKMTLFNMYHDFTFKKGTDASERVHFVLTKE